MRQLVFAISAGLIMAGQAVAAEASNDRWQLHRNIDPITDEARVSITLAADRELGLRGEPALIGFKCAGKYPDFGIVWPSSLLRRRGENDDTASVTWRFDSKPPEEALWSVLPRRNISFSPDPGAILAEAMNADRLVVRATSYAGEQMTATFNLEGLSDAIEPVRSACDWTQMVLRASELPPAVTSFQPEAFLPSPDPTPLSLPTQEASGLPRPGGAPLRQPASDPSSVANTLERLRAVQAEARQVVRARSSSAPAMPASRGEGGGSELLTAGEVRGIADKISQCWKLDAGIPGLAGIVVELRVEADAQGFVRVVRPAGSVPSEPNARTVFEAARQALMDPRCSPLPFPREKLTAVNRATFRFNPRGLSR